MKNTTITFKIQEDLAERLDTIKDDYFKGNRTSAITKAIEGLIASYSEEGTPVRDPPRLEAAKRQAEYIQNVMLYGSECDNVLRNEVLKLCQLIK